MRVLLAIFILITVLFITVLPSANAETSESDDVPSFPAETVRDWKVTQVAPAMFLFENSVKKLNALVSVEAVPASDEEAASYLQSPQFVQDAKNSRNTELFNDASGTVAATRTKIGQQMVGIIESDFSDNGYSFLITERIWIKNGLRFDVKIGSRGNVTPTSESHTIVFEEFASDLGLKTDSKSAGILNYIFPKAYAQSETGASRGRNRTDASPAKASIITDCKSLSGKIPTARLRSGPPSLLPNLSLSSCLKGEKEALVEMGKGAIAFSQQFVERTASMARTCGDAANKPEPYNSFLGRIRELARPHMKAVLEASCLPGALFMQSATLVSNGLNKVGGLVVNGTTAVFHGAVKTGKWAATGGPQSATARFANFIKNGGSPVHALDNYLAQRYPNYTCLTNSEKIKMICAVGTKFDVMVGIGGATSGAAKFALNLSRAADAVAAEEIGAGAAADVSAVRGAKYAEQYLKTGKFDPKLASSLTTAERREAGQVLLNAGKEAKVRNVKLLEERNKLIDDMHAVCSDSGFGKWDKGCIAKKQRLCLNAVAAGIASTEGCRALVKSGVAGQYAPAAPAYSAQTVSKVDPETGKPWFPYGTPMSTEADISMYRQAVRQFPARNWKNTITNWDHMPVSQQESTIRMWIKAKGLDGPGSMASEYAIRIFRNYRRLCELHPDKCG